MIAQHRPAQHVAVTALGQVDDLGVDGLGTVRLLPAELITNALVQFVVRVAEPAEQARSRGPRGAVDDQPELAGVDGVLRPRGQRREHLQSVGERQRVRFGERVEVGRGQLEDIAFEVPAAVEQVGVAPGPGARFGRPRGKRQAREQR